MNKLINVNIGGIVFQIDEQAYQKLDAYLTTIKKRYADSADGEEIVRDIEARIAELFTEKFNGNNQAIMMEHVEDVITIMGTPETYEQNAAGEETEYTERRRARGTRFFRDKDNNVLGGVCAGFAAKFGIDPLWIRLLFIVAMLFAGTGFLLYIILWIIIPEAKTTAEKLEMRGEKINIDNIEKKVKEGAQQIKTRMSEFGEEVRETFTGDRMQRTKKNAGDFIESAAATLKPVFESIAKIFVFALLMLCIVIVVVLCIEIFANWGERFTDINFLGSHIMEGTDEAWTLVACAIGLVIIPLVGLIFSSVKYLLGIKKKTRFVAGTLGMLWTICLIAVIWLGITIGRNFRAEAQVSNTFEIQQPAGAHMYIRLNDDVRMHAFWHEHYRDRDFYFDNDSMLFRQIHIALEKSFDTSYVAIVQKTARGADREDAKNIAEQFSFELKQVNDSTLVIPSFVQLADNMPWRNQEVYVTIRIPMDRYVTLDKNMEVYLDYNEYIGDLRDIERYNNTLKMTPSGLKPVF
ncbi:MAG: PspC domain-containing protein [Chitinophagales bacterium]